MNSGIAEGLFMSCRAKFRLKSWDAVRELSIPDLCTLRGLGAETVTRDDVTTHTRSAGPIRVGAPDSSIRRTCRVVVCADIHAATWRLRH